jgi:hypothetical protein
MAKTKIPQMANASGEFLFYTGCCKGQGKGPGTDLKFPALKKT